MSKLPALWTTPNSSSSPVIGDLLLENDSYLLLEDGSKLVLEDVTITPKIPTSWDVL